ncbi:nuclear transport factor 2 family protein [Ruegeria sp. HKCCD7255]|uniref:YybH family protein n=1 Tax=Ruegeria sp. HKCCD7255 TaxID=2683004 RepID=UPI001489C47B|nr:nuclear transport factor 2 family protein [Ruegeria sp. HKCCD7255]
MSIRQELEAVFEAYVAAFRRLDAKGCAACFTPDGQLFSPFGHAKGQGAIQALHADWLAEGGETKEMLVLDAHQSGNTAWCVAQYSESDSDERGVSVNILDRHADGTWRIRVCSLNED